MKRRRIRKVIARKLESFSYQLSSWAFRLRDWSDKVAPPRITRPLLVVAVMLGLGLPDCGLPLGIAHAASLSVAVVDTQGNTKTQSVNVDGEVTIGTDNVPNIQEIKAGLLYGETDGKRSSEYWHGSLKDRHNAGFISQAQWYWFSMPGIEADEFAGYDLRLSLHMGLGLYYLSPDTARHSFKIEAGPGVIAEEYEVTLYTETYTVWDVYLSARAWQEWKWQITDSVEFSEEAEYLYDYADHDNYRVNAEAGISADIYSPDDDGSLSIKLKLGPKVRYVNKPISGKERTDIISAATIIFSFR